MSARRKSANADVPQHNILLLEEYDALAAAISSALKKFAPQHFGAIARSIAEAEKLTADLKSRVVKMWEELRKDHAQQAE